ncbi:MAG: TonB-dependent receptor [Verrucomicrobia bacterium]|nr:TonB-dependent receptor [Verrucomicrobiota bacterium]
MRTNCLASLRLLAFAVLGLFATSVRSATLTITVRSAESAYLLKQARVELLPTGRDDMTDELGVAEFHNVAPGDYSARISYFGFDEQTVSVRVTAEARQNVLVKLKTGESVQMEQFVVTSEREGNAASLTRQKNADSVQNVIAMDALGVLANDNPAELLNRLPGVYSIPSDEGNLDRPVIRGLPATLNKTTVDGVTLVSQLAMSRTPIYTNITASNFEEIEVTKSLTPNLPADSISGLIKFKSKSTLNMKAKREITFRVGGKWSPTFFDYTPRRTVPQVQPQVQLGYREVFGLFGEQANLGLSGNFVYNDNVTQRTITDLTPDTTGRTPAFTSNFVRTDGIQDRLLQTGSVRVDFRANADSRYYLTAMRNFQEQTTTRPQNYQVAYTASVATAGRAFANGVTADGAPASGGNIRPGSTAAVTEVLHSTRTTFQAATNPFEADDLTDMIQFGGEHRLGEWKLDYTLNRSRAERDTGAYRNHAVRRNWTATVTNIGWILDKSRSEESPTFTQTSGPSIYDARNYANGTVSQTSAISVNRAASAEFNAKRPVSLRGQKILLSLGGLATRQSSDQDSGARNSTYVGPDGVAGVNPATRLNDDDLSRFASYPALAPRFGLGAVPRFDPLKYSHSMDNEPGQWRVDPYQVESSRRAGYRFVQEKILAGYVMGSTTFGRLGVVTGVRWEESKTEARAYIKRATLANITDAVKRTDAEYGTTPSARTGETRDFFPSLHFREAFTPNLIGRLSVATSIGRPALGDLTPIFSVSDVDHTVTLDNPSLKPQFATSYDLSLEYYLKPVGQLSLGLFRKDLTDFVFRQEIGIIGAGPSNGYEGQYGGYTILSNGNGGRGRVTGVEFSYLQQLTFLPSAFRGLTVLCNYTHLQAEGDYGQGSGGTNGLEGFVPNTANVRLSYKYRWFAPYVQWSHTDRCLNAYSPTPQLQTDRLARRVANAGFSLRLPRGLEFFFDVSNLFDEPQRVVQTTSGARTRTIYNGPFVSFGVNGRY